MYGGRTSACLLPFIARAFISTDDTFLDCMPAFLLPGGSRHFVPRTRPPYFLSVCLLSAGHDRTAHNSRTVPSEHNDAFSKFLLAAPGVAGVANHYASLPMYLLGSQRPFP